MKKLGKYELLYELNRDDLTTLYRARDTQMDREVVLKVLSAADPQQPEFTEQFVESAKIATNLPDPRIATVYDFGDDDGTLYLAMQPTRGITLRRFLDQHKQLTPGQALPILTHLAEVLDYVEARGLVYQTLDPDEVILESENEPPSVTITSIGEVREDLNGNEKSVLRHVLALAALNFEMLSGRPSALGKPPTCVSGRYTHVGALATEPQPANENIIEQTQQTSEVMQVLAQAQEVRSADDWLEVQALALQVAQRGNPDTEILEMLAEAAGAMYREGTNDAKRLQLANLYKQGERALRVKNWKSAVMAFEHVARADPNYHEVSEKLSQATAELKRAELYDQAVKQAAAGEKLLASHSWLTLLTEQWDYRQGEAVQQFMDVVEDLLDQIDQEQRTQQGGIFETERMLSLQNESFPEQFPNELTGTNELLDELSKQKTERLEGMLGWESKPADRTPETQEQNTIDNWLNEWVANKTERLERLPGQEPSKPSEVSENLVPAENWMEKLTTNRTERLGQLPGQEPLILGEVSENQVSADYWMDEQVSRRTERFEQIPLRKSENTTESLEKLVETSGWFDIRTTKKTEKLNDRPDTASARQEQSLNSDGISQGQDGKEMVHIPAGEFLYGAGRRLIQIDEFWIDKAPVTNAEYKRFLEARPEYPVPYSDLDEAQAFNWDRKTRSFPQGMASQPVVLVTFMDVQSYAKWAGKRLPTEEEWEKAARGTDGRTYPWGRILQNSVCNTLESGIGHTTPVGSFSPAGDSPYGCVDMSGNVWEWTESEYSETTMVVRGGSWCNSHLDAWCTTRAGNPPGTVKNSVGFRLVLK